MPDVIVQKSGRGWKVVLNPDVMPKLRINDLYAQAIRAARGAAAQRRRAGLSSRLQEARWFMKNIQQRFDTIQRVSQAIVERQKSFFTHGEIAMKPLVLREIADELGLHESTISRVTTAKYMSTPFGTFELKYFFGSSLNTEAGGNASSTAVRALIKQLVAAEDAGQAAVGQPALADARRAGHPGRAAHGGEVPRSAEDRAGEPAQGDVSGAAAVPALRGRRRGVARRRSAGACCRTARRAARRAAASRCEGDAARGRWRSTSKAASRSACCGEVADGPLPRRARSLRRWRAASTGRDWITPQQTLRVDTTAQRIPLQSLNFAALRIKDAVCDALRDATGERPSVDTRHPDLQLVLHLGAEHATLYVDTSGEPLFKRGWRERQGRCAAEGNAGRRDARRRRLARHAPKPAARCSTRAAAPARSRSRRRRSPAASRPG